jgi:competence protein ComEA
MPEIDRRRASIVGAVVVALLVLGGWQLRGRGEAEIPTEPGLPVQSAVTRAREPVVVHVAGAVRRPGVYRLSSGARVDDAVRRAGGATRRADLSAVNLAAPLEDGRQVLVPLRQRAAALGGGAAPAKVNLNTATAEDLDGLAGVGPATAAKILGYREQHGSFGSVDELGDVPGIGERRLEALRELVTV